MYFNIVTFKNGKHIAFNSDVPYSVDKTSNEWSVVTDAKNGQVISFRGSEVVAILSNKVEANNSKRRPRTPKIKTEIVSE